MSETTPTTAEQPAQQLSLPGAEEMFSQVGVTDLPLGAMQLTKRELQFALAYVRTGNATKAAAEAGYSDPAGNASKLLKRTDILKFLRPVFEEAGKNADALVQRVAARSRTLHDELMELRAKGDLRDMKRERQLINLVNRTDMLLGALLGKLQHLHVSADVNVNAKDGVVPLPASALPAMAQMRREVVSAQSGSGLRMGGPN